MLTKRNLIAFLVALGVMAAWDGTKLARKVVHNYLAVTTLIQNSQIAPSVDQSKIPSDLKVW